MKKTLLTLIIICFYFKGNSQIENHYSGAFESKNFEGTANYQYYTENNNRIFNGPFTFNSNDQYFKDTGSFNKDLKNGEWKTSIKNLTYNDPAVGILINAEILGNYSDGKKNGSWFVQKTRVFTPSNSGITLYNQTSADILSYLLTGKIQKKSEPIKIKEDVKADFKENHFVGKYEHNINDRILITGTFNSTGQCIDSWKIDYYENSIRHKIEITFKNGVINKVSDFNYSTGENLTTYQNDFDLQKFFANYSSDENYSVINEKVYSLKPIVYIPPSSKIEILKELLDNWNKSGLNEGYYLKEIDRGIVNETLNPINEIYLNEELTRTLKNQREDELRELKQKEFQNREKERKEHLIKQEEIATFNRSNAGQIQNEIQNRFNKWAKKGEFETKEQQTQRLTSSATQEFEKISNEIIFQNKDKFLSMSYQVDLGKYNSDNQSFYLTNKIDDQTILVRISPNIAAQLKEKILQESSSFNSHIYFIPIDAKLQGNDWAVSKAIVVFDFVTQQLKGEPKKFFTKDHNGKFYFKYEVLKRNGKFYPVSKTGYVQEGSMTKVELVNINSINKLNRKDKFLFSMWESNDITNEAINFDYEIIEDKAVVRRK